MSTVLYVGGNHQFLRTRFVRKVIQAEVLKGRRLFPLDGSDSQIDLNIEQVFSTSTLFNQKMLIHISDADQVKNLSFLEHTSEDIIVLLESKKKTKPKSKKTKTASVKMFNEPPFYKVEGHAIDFLMDEVASRGFSLDPTLAKKIVQAVGKDLGILTFEALKMCSMSSSEDITVGVVKATLAPIAEIGPDQIIHSLETKDLNRLLRSMRKYRGHQKYDPTILLCGRYLSPLFFKWLQASSSPYLAKETAEKVGSSSWYWKNKIVPPSKRWGTEGILELIQGVSEVQGSVRRGIFSPWTLLETHLVKACSR